jgi:hypothetical protein
MDCRKIAALGPTTARSRNASSGTSGAGERRSANTKRPRSNAPETPKPSVVGDVQPSSGTLETA